MVPASAASDARLPATSAEARALREEADRLSREFRVSAQESDEAADRIEYPDPPEALYALGRDYMLFARNPTPSWSDKGRGRY